MMAVFFHFSEEMENTMIRIPNNVEAIEKLSAIETPLAVESVCFANGSQFPPKYFILVTHLE